MNIRRHIREQPSQSSSALNDILFVFLLYFLIICTHGLPNVIKLSVPKAQSDTKTKQTVVVSINDKQQFFVGSVNVGVDSLKFYISGAIAKTQDAEPTVVINADKQAIADNIVAVMRVAHDLNLRTVLAVDNNKK